MGVYIYWIAMYFRAITESPKNKKNRDLETSVLLFAIKDDIIRQVVRNKYGRKKYWNFDAGTGFYG